MQKLLIQCSGWLFGLWQVQIWFSYDYMSNGQKKILGEVVISHSTQWEVVAFCFPWDLPASFSWIESADSRLSEAKAQKKPPDMEKYSTVFCGSPRIHVLAACWPQFSSFQKCTSSLSQKKILPRYLHHYCIDGAQLNILL